MTALPVHGYISDLSRDEAEVQQALEDTLDVIRQQPGGSVESTLTIAAGIVTPTGGIHAIDTEAAAATDDLTNIDQTNLPDGATLLINGANAAHVVTLKHGAGGVGQVLLADKADLALDTIGWIWLKRTGTSWEELMRSPGNSREALHLTNGYFTCWQRGAGNSAVIAVPASSVTPTADRWYANTGANQACTVSAQPSFLPGDLNCARFQRNAGQAGTATIVHGCALPTEFVRKMRGRVVTISSWVRTGANWSPAALGLTLYTGTGGEAKRAAGFTGQATVAGVAPALAAGAGATLLSATSAAAVASNVNQGQIEFAFTPVGPAGAADYFEAAAVRIDYGSRVGSETIDPGFELFRCQEFAAKTFSYGVAPASNLGSFAGALVEMLPTGASGTFGRDWTFPRRMRTTPAITTYSTHAASADWWDPVSGTGRTASIGTVSERSAAIFGAGGVAGKDNYIQAFADAEI